MTNYKLTNSVELTSYRLSESQTATALGWPLVEARTAPPNSMRAGLSLDLAAGIRTLIHRDGVEPSHVPGINRGRQPSHRHMEPGHPNCRVSFPGLTASAITRL